MSTRNFENDDDLSGLGGNTHHPTATGGSEWGFGNISEGEPLVASVWKDVRRR